MNRRFFLKLGAGAVGTGLLLKIVYDNKWAILEKVKSYSENMEFDANAFIFIQSDGLVKIICHRSEMGQGIRTGLPMVMADELDVAWEQIEIIQADADEKYGSQNTDGSKSIRDFWIPLRTAAAAAREMMVLSAAGQWEVPAEECYTLNGKVLHRPTQRELGYGELVGRAKNVQVPKNPKLKDTKDFKIIGHPKVGYDVKAYTTGQAQFGIDVQVPDMKCAALLRAPVPGATIVSIDDSEAKKLSGVIAIETLDTLSAPNNMNASVAVIAENTWIAFRARDLLKVEWDYKNLKLDNSADFKNEIKASLKKDLKVLRHDGDVKGAKNKTSKILRGTYHTPYLVHSPMEPLVCTAHVTANSCEVWAPCQDPQRSVKEIAALLEMDSKNIKFHVTFLGGGFGRKSQSDFVLESVLLSKKTGRPIKSQWSREDEIKHGFYHAESYQELEAGLDKNGLPLFWDHKTSFPTIMKTFLPIVKTPADWEVGMAASNMPYRIPNVEVSAGTIESSLRIGWLRSVCNLWHCFAVESFVDELADAARMDPIQYRMKLLGEPRIIEDNKEFPQDIGRMIQVIEKVKNEFSWGKALPKGHGQGFASQFSFLSYVAMAMEVQVIDQQIEVKRVVSCIDCGLAVNPESVKAQMEGAIVFGLSAALHGKITLDQGRVEQSNFHDYPILRMNQVPKIEVHIINGNDAKPTGVGEPGVPPVAPALANAIFSASGKRLRDLPLSLI